jgi:hypothetical protein
MSEFSAISEIADHGKMHIDKHVVSLDGRVVFKTDRTRPRHRAIGLAAVAARKS